jgi:hypothetical protein
VLVAAAAALGSGRVVASGGPLSTLGGSISSGSPALTGSSALGVSVRFIDRGSFWVALIVRNTSSQPVTLVQASALEPPNSLVRETSAGFSRYLTCTGREICPPPMLSPTSSKPLTLRPHGEAAIKFSYQLVSCKAAKGASTASGSSLLVTYRFGSGRVAVETVPLGGARLQLQRPAGVACLPRPFSYIGLVGSFTTSPKHRPVPGSSGDLCSKKAAGGLAFTSRAFTDRSGTTFQIEITLPHYRGIGVYRRGATALGPAEVTAVFGTPGPTTIFHDPRATVTVTIAHGTTLGGRLGAVFSGHRRFFRAYGNWRCTTRR